ncbi:phospholipid scramblase-related protein [Alkalibacillus haloalkaliphilus]|uniref:phospholipid scramblase-related protein n=1 Tax=Alkalibacillus haloalkaliphilus TaxID=94136 RepID=UPI001C3FB8B4|nr:phospholipid scramblase-related protein [Alkalibacillus haloalkaliphilus]
MEKQTTFYIKQQNKKTVELDIIKRRKKYLINNEKGHPLFSLKEINDNLIHRIFLSKNRPFKMKVYQTEAEFFTFERLFSFFKHTINVYDSDCNLIGKVTKKLFRFRKYEVKNNQGKSMYFIASHLVKRSNFEIKGDNYSVGLIKKERSKSKKTFLKPNGSFGMELVENLSNEHKILLIAAVILIDFVHYNN